MLKQHFYNVFTICKTSVSCITEKIQNAKKSYLWKFQDIIQAQEIVKVLLGAHKLAMFLGNFQQVISKLKFIAKV